MSSCYVCNDRRLVGGFLPAPCPNCTGADSESTEHSDSGVCTKCDLPIAIYPVTADEACVRIHPDYCAKDSSEHVDWRATCLHVQSVALSAEKERDSLRARIAELERERDSLRRFLDAEKEHCDPESRWEVKGLAELIAENNELARRADAKRETSIRRLKQRIARASYLFDRMTTGRMRREINAVIDAWAEAEKNRGGR